MCRVANPQRCACEALAAACASPPNPSVTRPPCWPRPCGNGDHIADSRRGSFRFHRLGRQGVFARILFAELEVPPNVRQTGPDQLPGERDVVRAPQAGDSKGSNRQNARYQATAFPLMDSPKRTVPANTAARVTASLLRVEWVSCLFSCLLIAVFAERLANCRIAFKSMFFSAHGAR